MYRSWDMEQPECLLVDEWRKGTHWWGHCSLYVPSIHALKLMPLANGERQGFQDAADEDGALTGGIGPYKRAREGRLPPFCSSIVGGCGICPI